MLSIVVSVFLGFACLITALPGQGVRREFVFTTVTLEAHPLLFTPLTTLAPTATPLTYNSPPTPSKVSTTPTPAFLEREEESNTPPSISTDSTSTSALTAPLETTTACTKINGTSPASTVPPFCKPRLFTNAPILLPSQPIATTALGANSVPDKVSCCGACADYYNCIAWRFVPSSMGIPSDRQPGGFDPWLSGDCEIAYYTGDTSGSATQENDTLTTDVASICPNGRVLGMLNGTTNQLAGRWLDGLYYNGWNEGACGTGVRDALFRESGDPGFGDGETLCSV